MSEDQQQESGGETLLSQLMAALASGARAVQNLPLGDEFEYQFSYPEFRKLIETNHGSLIDVLLLALQSSSSSPSPAQPSTTSSSSSSPYDEELGGGGLENIDSLDDPLLWEACADICEGLLEQAET